MNSAGFLYNKARNMRKKKTADEPKESDCDENLAEDEEESIYEKPLTEAEENELLLYFKSCTIANDKAEIKEKLKQTVSFRQRKLQDTRTNLPEMFSFFFAAPDLVSLIFHIYL